MDWSVGETVAGKPRAVPSGATSAAAARTTLAELAAAGEAARTATADGASNFRAVAKAYRADLTAKDVVEYERAASSRGDGGVLIVVWEREGGKDRASPMARACLATLAALLAKGLDEAAQDAQAATSKAAATEAKKETSTAVAVASLARYWIRRKATRIYTYISQGDAAMVAALLHLLAVLARAEPRELVHALDLASKVWERDVGRMLNRSADVRKACMDMLLAFFESGDTKVMTTVAGARKFISLLFLNWNTAPHELTLRTVTVLRERVCVPKNVPKRLKTTLFGPRALAGIVRGFDSFSAADGQDAAQVAAALRDFLVLVCTSPYRGIRFVDENWTRTRSVVARQTRNPILLKLALGLRQANETVDHYRLLLDVLAAAPDIIGAYFKDFPFALDPRPSAKWLANVTLACKVIELEQVSFAGLDHAPTALAADLAEALFPTQVANKVVLSKGLQSKNALVVHNVLILLVAVLEKAVRVADDMHAEWTACRSAFLAAVRVRMPDLQAILAVQAKTGAAGSDRLVYLTALRLIHNYILAFPEAVPESRFDFFKLLLNAPELEPQAQLGVLRIAGAVARVPSAAETAARSSRVLAVLTALVTSSRSPLVYRHASAVLETLLAASGLFPADSTPIWINALTGPDDAAFLGNVVGETTRGMETHMRAALEFSAEAAAERSGDAPDVASAVLATPTVACAVRLASDRATVAYVETVLDGLSASDGDAALLGVLRRHLASAAGDGSKKRKASVDRDVDKAASSRRAAIEALGAVVGTPAFASKLATVVDEALNAWGSVAPIVAFLRVASPTPVLSLAEHATLLSHLPVSVLAGLVLGDDTGANLGLQTFLLQRIGMLEARHLPIVVESLAANVRALLLADDREHVADRLDTAVAALARIVSRSPEAVDAAVLTSMWYALPVPAPDAALDLDRIATVAQSICVVASARTFDASVVCSAAAHWARILVLHAKSSERACTLLRLLVRHADRETRHAVVRTVLGEFAQTSDGDDPCAAERALLVRDLFTSATARMAPEDFVHVLELIETGSVPGLEQVAIDALQANADSFAPFVPVKTFRSIVTGDATSAAFRSKLLLLMTESSGASRSVVRKQLATKDAGHVASDDLAVAVASCCKYAAVDGADVLASCTFVLAGLASHDAVAATGDAWARAADAVSDIVAADEPHVAAATLARTPEAQTLLATVAAAMPQAWGALPVLQTAVMRLFTLLTAGDATPVIFRELEAAYERDGSASPPSAWIVYLEAEAATAVAAGRVTSSFVSPTLIRAATRARFGIGRALRLVASLLDLLGSAFPTDVSAMCDSVVGHAQFRAMIRGASTESATDALALLEALYRLVPARMSPTVLHQLVSAYRGTFGPTDRALLRVMRRFEVAADMSICSFGSLFGQHTPALKSGEQAQFLASRTTKIEAAVSAGMLKPDVMLRSAQHFPENVRLPTAQDLDAPEADDSGRVAEEADSTIYDPSFVVPFLVQWTSRDDFDARIFLDCNAVAVAVAALSSHCTAMRAMAGLALDRFQATAEAGRLRERHQMAAALGCLRNAVTPTTGRLPRLTTQFVVASLAILVRPDSQLYSIVNKFYLQRPALDIEDVPLFYNLFNSGRVDYKHDRMWMLKLLALGLASASDIRIYGRRKVFDMLMAYADSPAGDTATNRVVGQVISRAIDVDASYLVVHTGLVTWLQVVLARRNAPRHLQALVLGLVERLMACDGPLDAWVRLAGAAVAHVVETLESHGDTRGLHVADLVRHATRTLALVADRLVHADDGALVTTNGTLARLIRLVASMPTARLDDEARAHAKTDIFQFLRLSRLSVLWPAADGSELATVLELYLDQSAARGGSGIMQLFGIIDARPALLDVILRNGPALLPRIFRLHAATAEQSQARVLLAILTRLLGRHAGGSRAPKELEAADAAKDDVAAGQFLIRALQAAAR